LREIIEELPNKPFLVGEEGISMSLAGVQMKLAVAIDDEGRVCIPMYGSPSTHILKPDAPRLRGGVQNEAFCLTLARRMGIPTPDVTTGEAGKRSYLLISPLFAPVDAVCAMDASGGGCLSRQEDCRPFA
jgi:serine/threonine-protein kinase HipA